MPWTTEGSFISAVDGIKIKYACLVKEKDTDAETKERPVVVFLTGWKECYEKYRSTLLEELYSVRGFDVYTMDHRSQGFSDDMPGTKMQKGNADGSGRRICYVDDMDATYVADARQFLREVVGPPSSSRRITVMGHSMGGLITLRLAQEMAFGKEQWFDRAIASAPMVGHKNVLDVMGVDVELPLGMASGFATTMSSLLGQPTVLADGRDTDASRGTTELLTHCPTRRASWDALRRAHPSIVLAGASFGWGAAAFECERRCLADATTVSVVPTLLFMAEDDAFVYNSSIQEYAMKARGRSKVTLVGPVGGTYHELLAETDDVTATLVDAMVAFANSPEGDVPPELLQRIPPSTVSFSLRNRWPKGFHSGFLPPVGGFPVPLLFRSNPIGRVVVNIALRGVLMAAIVKGVTVLTQLVTE